MWPGDFDKNLRGLSSVGRALDWQSRGHRFDPVRLHSKPPASSWGFFISLDYYSLNLFLSTPILYQKYYHRKLKMKYVVYVLRSTSSNRLYIGQTNDLSRRMRQHRSNAVISTRNRGPWELIRTVPCETRSEAVELELRLKRMKNPKRVLNYLARDC